jgi:hypothetical protein
VTAFKETLRRWVSSRVAPRRAGRSLVGLACTVGWLLSARAVAVGGTPLEGVVGLVVALVAARSDAALERMRIVGAKKVRRGLVARPVAEAAGNTRWLRLRSGSAR